jgi:hypothetical protein
MSRSKKDEKILELSYTIEALKDEVDYWKEQHDLKQSRISQLIQENDRLTLTYEPYRPSGDEDANISYYDLKKENKRLRSKRTLKDFLRPGQGKAETD